MTSRIRNVGGGISRSFGRAFVVMLLAVLIASPAMAQDDIVLKWNEIASRTATATHPFNQARVMAIVQLSVFEAVNAITGDYKPYLNPALEAPAGASLEAAVVIAYHKTLTTYFTAPATVALLDAARDSDLERIADVASQRACRMERLAIQGRIDVGATREYDAVRAVQGRCDVTFRFDGADRQADGVERLQIVLVAAAADVRDVSHVRHMRPGTVAPIRSSARVICWRK